MLAIPFETLSCVMSQLLFCCLPSSPCADIFFRIEELVLRLVRQFPCRSQACHLALLARALSDCVCDLLGEAVAFFLVSCSKLFEPFPSC